MLDIVRGRPAWYKTRMRLDELMLENLLTMATAMAESRGTSLSAISRQAHGDYDTFAKLQAGNGSITGRKYDDSMAYFHDRTNWPEGSNPPRIYEPWRQRQKGSNGKGKEGRRQVPRKETGSRKGGRSEKDRPTTDT